MNLANITKNKKKYYSLGCNVYKKSYRYKSQLTFHKIIHTGEKPYKCDVCDMGYSIKFYLFVHKRI